MKQGTNSRRPRGRNNNKRQTRNNNFDSSGPEGRVRGNARQVYEKYLALASDALAADDRIASENYYQHAEHYFRIVNTQAASDAEKEAQKDGNNNRNHRNNNNNNRNQQQGNGGGQPQPQAEAGNPPTQDQGEQPAISTDQPETLTEQVLAEEKPADAAPVEPNADADTGTSSEETEATDTETASA